MSASSKKSLEPFTQIILDSISDAVFTVDHEWRITSFNRAAEDIVGISRRQALGRRCCDVLRASICESQCALRATLKSGESVVGQLVYIVDADGEQVPVSISTALLRNSRGDIIGGVETFRDLREATALRKELQRRYQFGDIISKNREMRRLFALLPQIAASESTVLIQGESGTGKELVARVVHNLSPRKERTMVAINCGALPDTLLESELFGYKAGAFTDARKDKPGRFAQAEGGTIFLDEIGDISPALQIRLLRVLQERVYEPLGAEKPQRADVRIIAASHADLDDRVQQGLFRQDLYYRINVVKIILPPLRDRREDIPLLVRHFLTKYNGLTGKRISGVSHEVMRLLLNHDYPGNVRELENIIEHAFVLCRDELITLEHLPAERVPDAGAVPAPSLRKLEAEYITRALERNNWHRTATARELGLHVTTLHRKIKRLGLELPPHDGRSSRSPGSSP